MLTLICNNVNHIPYILCINVGGIYYIPGVLVYSNIAISKRLRGTSSPGIYRTVISDYYSD